MHDETKDYEFRERSRLLFFGLPFTFTTYEVKEDTITTKRGFLNTTEDDCYMYKIQDVKLTTSFLERIFGVATLFCYTGDVTDKELILKHIKNGKKIKDYILDASETARIKRRTMHVNDIGVDGDYTEEM